MGVFLGNDLKMGVIGCINGAMIRADTDHPGHLARVALINEFKRATRF